MRAMTIEARSLGSARRLYKALSDFEPELSGSERQGYRVSVELGTRERRLLDLLDAIERYVTETGTDPALIEMDGHRYTMHAAHA